jgi:hypothetical protein
MRMFSTRTTLGTIAAVAVIAAGGYLFFGRGAAAKQNPISAAAAGGQCCKDDPAALLRLTLDPRLFQGDVRKAYTVAQDDPALLAQLHCYCGCDKEIGHKNLLDCFRSKHGSTCAICVGEAVEAEQLARQGMPVEQIRDALRARFAGAHGS